MCHTKVDISSRIMPHLHRFERVSYVSNPHQKLQDYGFTPSQVIDCSLGVNPYGFAPPLKEVIARFNKDLFQYYPEPTNEALRKGILAFWEPWVNLEANQLAVGTGSMGVLMNINRILLHPGSKILGFSPQFVEYITEAKACGAEYHYVPLEKENNYAFKVEDLLAKLDDSYTLVYIDNPNNPTGQILDLQEIETVVQRAAQLNVIVVVDEAYGNFMPSENSAVLLTHKYDNLITVRSFSKGSGLADLRVGYGVTTEPLMRYLNKVTMAFLFSRLGESLAVASLENEDYIAQCRQRIAHDKKALMDKLSVLNVAHTSLEVPIMTLYHGKPDLDLYDVFLRQGILTSAGVHFVNLGKNAIRLRLPADITDLKRRLRSIEESV